MPEAWRWNPKKREVNRLLGGPQRHTALVGGYIIEGHVPADLIQKLLKEKPKVKGLAVPGMVTGSPGMEGNPKQAYDVVTFDAAGRTTVYAKR